MRNIAQDIYIKARSQRRKNRKKLFVSTKLQLDSNRES